MKIHEMHVRFYQAKTLPTWAKTPNKHPEWASKKEPRDLIDDVINWSAGIKMHSLRTRAALSLIDLLKGCRRLAEKNVVGYGTLAAYLGQIITGPNDNVYDRTGEKRKAVARRWLKRLNKK